MRLVVGHVSQQVMRWEQFSPIDMLTDAQRNGVVLLRGMVYGGLVATRQGFKAGIACAPLEVNPRHRRAWRGVYIGGERTGVGLDCD
jgi:hypothetical protein